MRIVIISTNTEYKVLFEKYEEAKTVLIWDTIKVPTITIDMVLLDGETFNLDHLDKVREIFPTCPIYYKPGSINSDIIMRNTTRLCAAYKVKVINEYSTLDQVVEQVMNETTDKNNYLRRIVSFFGTHSGAGVTTTVLNLARSLSQKVKDKVLVLSLNSWDPADYFYDYRGQYLNDLKVDLKTNNLTPARLSEAVYYNQSFYHLAGNRDIKMQRFFQPSEIQHLIEIAKQVFDVILIDGGTHFDTAPTVQAYLSSNLRFLVTNQEEKGYRGYFPYVFQQLIEPTGGKSEDFMLVINKYQPHNTLISEKALEDELEMTKVATLPDLGDLGTMAAYQKRLLYDLGDPMFMKSIDLVSNVIISECRLSEKDVVTESKKDRKGLFSLFR
ncbi:MULTISPECIES: ParA family protein [Bacillati]|uniref:ParA family protein n=1 Tax=Bacillati TaxID=1783272 RepID=UPI0022B94F9D|nr:ParA family protein [Caldifermentibacillus hisashii]